MLLHEPDCNNLKLYRELKLTPNSCLQINRLNGFVLAFL